MHSLLNLKLFKESLFKKVLFSLTTNCAMVFHSLGSVRLKLEVQFIPIRQRKQLTSAKIRLQPVSNHRPAAMYTVTMLIWLDLHRPGSECEYASK